MSFYAEMEATVTELVSEFGTTGILRKIIDPGSWDNDTGEMTNRVVSDQTCRYLRDNGQMVRLSDQALIPVTGNRYIMSTQGISEQPVTGFRLVTDTGIELDIKMVDPIKPGPTILGWFIDAGDI